MVRCRRCARRGMHVHKDGVLASRAGKWSYVNRGLSQVKRYSPYFLSGKKEKVRRTSVRDRAGRIAISTQMRLLLLMARHNYPALAISQNVLLRAPYILCRTLPERSGLEQRRAVPDQAKMNILPLRDAARCSASAVSTGPSVRGRSATTIPHRNEIREMDRAGEDEDAHVAGCQ